MRSGRVHKSVLEQEMSRNPPKEKSKSVGTKREKTETILTRDNVELIASKTGAQLMFGIRPKRPLKVPKLLFNKKSLEGFHGKGEVIGTTSEARNSLMTIHLPGLSFTSFGSLAVFLKLKEVNLSFNKITDISQMTLPLGLRKLDLKGNFLRSVYKTEKSNTTGPSLKLVSPLFTAKRLQILQLSCNFIEEIPPQFFRLLPELKMADFSFNCIGNFPDLTGSEDQLHSFSL